MDRLRRPLRLCQRDGKARQTLGSVCQLIRICAKSALSESSIANETAPLIVAFANQRDLTTVTSCAILALDRAASPLERQLDQRQGLLRELIFTVAAL